MGISVLGGWKATHPKVKVKAAHPQKKFNFKISQNVHLVDHLLEVKFNIWILPLSTLSGEEGGTNSVVPGNVAFKTSPKVVPGTISVAHKSRLGVRGDYLAWVSTTFKACVMSSPFSSSFHIE